MNKQNHKMPKLFEVGGCVRDELLGVHTNDIDYTFVLDDLNQTVEQGFSQMKKFLQQKAKVVLDDGSMFGSGGEGFQRINIACPKSVLEDALMRINKAIRELVG